MKLAHCGINYRAAPTTLEVEIAPVLGVNRGAVIRFSQPANKYWSNINQFTLPQYPLPTVSRIFHMSLPTACEFVLQDVLHVTKF